LLFNNRITREDKMQTVQERINEADEGSMLELGVTGLLILSMCFSIICLVCFMYVRHAFGMHGELGLLGILGLLVGGPSVLASCELVLMALWKNERDQFWYAIEQINMLDLRQ
jgi:hypothetical protein